VVVIVAGLAGSGKTTVGAMLAGRMGWEFADADDFHPAANLAKMRTGIPLDDADRWPWLAAIATWMDHQITAGHCAVIACSALRQRYRDVLLDGRPAARLVFLDVDADRLRHRLEMRPGHFFPERLLSSQLAVVERPLSGPRILVLTPGDRPADTVGAIVSWLAEETRDEAEAGPARHL
jgi:gluconokinase